GNFQAYLSDFSAPAYTDTSWSSIYDNTNAVYTLNYAAASAGQALVIKYTAKTLYDRNFGNVTLQAAVIPNTPPGVPVIADQSVDEGSPLTLTPSETDSDIPANILTYSL